MGDEKKKSAGAKKAVMTVILGVACGAFAVMVVAARRPMPSTEVAGDVESTSAVQATDAPVAAASAVEAATTAAKPAETPAEKPAKKALVKTAASRKAPVAASVPVQDSSVGTTAAAIPMATPQVIEEPKAAAVTTEVPMATVTINGCLERDGDTFRLKDTDGAAAPKARSWKSGFLKKGSARIEVIDTANRLKLRDHVGQRVSVSGMLEDREMHARSVQRVSTFCE